MRRVAQIVAIVLFVVMISSLGRTCSLVAVPADFHQVTAIRGRVVGKNLGPLQFRWLRQSFSVSSADLTLYEYRWPAKVEDLKMIAAVRSDSRGDFDFGSIAKGHYSLVISVKYSNVMGGSFDVEVTDTVKTTDSVTLDVSPIRPDCTGGHEFIENKKS